MYNSMTYSLENNYLQWKKTYFTNYSVVECLNTYQIYLAKAIWAKVTGLKVKDLRVDMFYKKKLNAEILEKATTYLNSFDMIVL